MSGSKWDQIVNAADEDNPSVKSSTNEASWDIQSCADIGKA